MTDTKNWYPTVTDAKFALEVQEKIDKYIPPWVTDQHVALAMICHAMNLNPYEVHSITVNSIIH